MIAGYLRVSTCKQHLTNQKEEILRYAETRQITVDCWVTEIVSGKKHEKERKLGLLLRRLKPGDTLIVTELSRLSRTLTDIMAIMGKCLKKEINLLTTKEGYSFDNSINSKVLCFAFGLVAEIERNLISMRTKEALALRKAAGIKLGRPPGKSRKKENAYKSWDAISQKIKEGIPLSEIARQYKIHRNTLRNYMNEKESYSTANGAGVEKPEI